jgi:uncharacterized protein YecE (DUF72 family)
MKYFIGLPQWHHPKGYAQGQARNTSLTTYRQHLSSVEGNTPFYGLPKKATISTWLQTTPETFRFCLKFPRTMSHDAQLQHCIPALSQRLQKYVTR